jgi:predicted transcriptional regulator
MQRTGLLCIGLLASLILFTGEVACADNGGYEVRPATPEEVAKYHSEHPDDMKPISFWELPLWVQMTYLSGTLAAILLALKLVPFAFLKLKQTTANRNRDTIYRFIEENPGCTTHDIARGESLNLGSVRYHVYRLELARKIRQVKAGKFLRMFRNNGAYDAREIEVISALNIRTNRAIVSLLGADSGLSNKQIADRLKIKTSLAHVYLSGLVKDRIIRFEKNEQRKRYYLESDVYGIIKKTGGQSPSRHPGI